MQLFFFKEGKGGGCRENFKDNLIAIPLFSRSLPVHQPRQALLECCFPLAFPLVTFLLPVLLRGILEGDCSSSESAKAFRFYRSQQHPVL